MAARRKTVCAVCQEQVTANYDHVGDCETPGACSGTFSHHESGRHDCGRHGRDLTHAEVVQTTRGDDV